MFFLIPIITTLASGVGAAGAAVAGTAAAAGTAVAAGAATAAGLATSTTGLAVLGTYGAAKVLHDGAVENARREGYQNGLRQGNIDTAKKFEQRFKEFLEKSDANKIATWALGVHVANLDGIEDEELAVIYKKIGDPNSNLVSPYLRSQYMAIYEKCPRFGEIQAKYLNVVETEFLVELNEYVNQIILSDQVVSDEENDFLNYEWYPYLQRRGIQIGDPSQSAMSRSSSSNNYSTSSQSYSNKTSDSSIPAAEVFYSEGKRFDVGGLAPNRKLAFENYKKAAELGHPKAQYRLAQLYEFGTGVNEDRDMAKYWYTKAANQGIAAAKSYLVRF